MQVAVDGPMKMGADELSRLQVELESTDEVYVKRVEIGEQWLESEPAPARNAARKSLTPSF